MPDLSTLPPSAWMVAGLAIALAAALLFHPPTRAAILDIVRVAKGAPAPSPVDPPAPCAPGPPSPPPDELLWAATDKMAGGLPVPFIAFDYERTVKAWNEEAMALTGYRFHAVDGHDFTVLLPDDDESGFVGWLARYLREHKDGEVPQWQRHERKLRLKRATGEVVDTTAFFTHFGNGHGGLFVVLAPDA